MGFWHRMKVRLGLEDEWDDEYGDEEYYDADSDDGESDSPSSRGSVISANYGSGAGSGAVRRVDRGLEVDRPRSGATLRSVPSGRDARASGTPPQVKMHICEPKSFAEAQAIADKFKQDTPVILNLTAAQPDVAKRLLDFAAGLTYGLDGGLQKVSEKVFMLSPMNVEVSDSDRRRLQSTGLFPTPE